MPYLTRRGHYLAIISAASIFVGLISNSEFIFFTGVAGVSILIYYFNWISRYADLLKDVVIDRVEPSLHVIEGVEFTISFKFLNGSRYKLPRIVIVDEPEGRVVCEDPIVEAFDIESGEKIILSYKAYSGVGSSIWRKASLLLYDPLNIFVEIKELVLPVSVYAYPYPMYREGYVRHIPLGISRILNLQSRTGMEFLELREYVYGDDYRMIHWPSTARYGDLVVKVNAVESLLNLTVVVDVSREMWVGMPGSSPIDNVARVVTWLAETVSKYNGRINLVVFDGYSYRRYIYHAREAVNQVSTVFSRLMPGRFRSPRDLVHTVRTVSSERPSDILIVLSGPGVIWKDFIPDLEENIHVSHPLVYLGISMPMGNSKEEMLVRLHEVKVLDELFGRVGHLRMSYGSAEELIASLEEVMRLWM